MLFALNLVNVLFHRKTHGSKHVDSRLLAPVTNWFWDIWPLFCFICLILQIPSLVINQDYTSPLARDGTKYKVLSKVKLKNYLTKSFIFKNISHIKYLIYNIYACIYFHPHVIISKTRFELFLTYINNELMIY